MPTIRFTGGNGNERYLVNDSQTLELGPSVRVLGSLPRGPPGLSGLAKQSPFLFQLGKFGVRVSEPSEVSWNAPRPEQAALGN